MLHYNIVHQNRLFIDNEQSPGVNSKKSEQADFVPIQKVKQSDKQFLQDSHLGCPEQKKSPASGALCSWLTTSNILLLLSLP